MAEEIDQYLLDKLNEAISDTKAADRSLSNKMFRMDKDFATLKELLQSRSAPLIATDDIKRREILYHLNNLLSEWQMITNKKCIYAPEGLAAAYKLNKSLNKIKKELKGGDSSTPGAEHAPYGQQVNEEPNILQNYRWSSRFRPKNVYGLDDKIRFMERLLVKDESADGFKAIAIVGIPGVGKTALSQVMFNHEEVKNKYLVKLWVCLSKQPNDDPDSRKEVVKRILISLGVEDEIIRLAGQNQDQDQGLRRLIFALRLPLLKKQELCWDIFKGAVEKDGKVAFPQELESLKDLVVKKCGGLPLAATMMGEIMRQKLSEAAQKPCDSGNQQQQQQIARHETI